MLLRVHERVLTLVDNHHADSMVVQVNRNLAANAPKPTHDDVLLHALHLSS